MKYPTVRARATACKGERCDGGCSEDRLEVSIPHGAAYPGDHLLVPVPALRGEGPTNALPPIRSGNLAAWAGGISTWDELAHLHPEEVLFRLEAMEDALVRIPQAEDTE